MAIITGKMKKKRGQQGRRLARPRRVIVSFSLPPESRNRLTQMRLAREERDREHAQGNTNFRMEDSIHLMPPEERARLLREAMDF